mmetsp:Transcript_5716/g.10892  ORF Transcript_5716/g.10892 Transcript_5716/m.10892 type:complete len:203 (+) Transcript_5716:1462-2070(+)
MTVIVVVVAAVFDTPATAIDPIKTTFTITVTASTTTTLTTIPLTTIPLTITTPTATTPTLFLPPFCAFTCQITLGSETRRSVQAFSFGPPLCTCIFPRCFRRHSDFIHSSLVDQKLCARLLNAQADELSDKFCQRSVFHIRPSQLQRHLLSLGRTRLVLEQAQQHFGEATPPLIHRHAPHGPHDLEADVFESRFLNSREHPN